MCFLSVCGGECAVCGVCARCWCAWFIFVLHLSFFHFFMCGGVILANQGSPGTWLCLDGFEGCGVAAETRILSRFLLMTPSLSIWVTPDISVLDLVSYLIDTIIHSLSCLRY